VMLLILRPFRVGHFVEIGGQQGTVREIGLFTTVMTTRDQVYVSMPNSSIFSAIIINYTREPLRRVKFLVPVDRANDLDKVEKTIRAALAANRFCIDKPEPSVVVLELQEYTAVMRARAFVRSNDYWQAIYAMQKEVQAALNAAEILLPVNRQAPVVRNEPLSPLTAPPAEAPPPALPEAPRPGPSPSAH
jgi:small conductance mechanosensitive channel